MMEENESEKVVKEYLCSIDLSVTRIPRSERDKRPDYLVSDGINDYLLEIKSREKDEGFLKLFETANPGERTHKLGRINPLSSMILEGAKQLNNYDPSKQKRHILWCYTADLWYGSIVARQLAYTIYGLMDVEGYYKNNTYFQTGCFYFTYNDFFRTPQLDAVVIQSPDELSFCLNAFSSSYNEFKQSLLRQRFEKEGFVIVDPVQLENEGRCFLVDADIDRKDSNGVLRYITEKYNLLSVNGQDFSLVTWPL